MSAQLEKVISLIVKLHSMLNPWWYLSESSIHQCTKLTYHQAAKPLRAPGIIFVEWV